MHILILRWRVQVARARHACIPQQEAPKEPTAADRERLAQLQKLRLADIVSKQCMSVLKSILAHKVHPHSSHLRDVMESKAMLSPLR